MGTIENKKPHSGETARSPRVIRPEWLARFKVDALAHLAEINHKFILLPAELGQTTSREETEAEQQALYEIYRRSHSIKGSASMVGLTEIANKARRLEELLKRAYEAPARFDSEQRTSATRQLEELRELLNTELR